MTQDKQEDTPQLKPLCLGAWAIPPSPLMLKHGNDYHTCSECGEPAISPEDPLDQGFQRVFGKYRNVDELEDIELPPRFNLYLQAKAMRDDDRSMPYIARRLGFNNASSVDSLLKTYAWVQRYTEQREAEMLQQKQIKPLGKRRLRELIEDAWYDAPSANAGFGRIEVIIESYVKQRVLDARIEEMLTAQRLLHTKPLDSVVSASKERVMDDWFKDKIAIYETQRQSLEDKAA